MRILTLINFSAVIVFATIVVHRFNLHHFPSAAAQEKYQCMPCGSECDSALFDGPGECPHCHMKLVKQSTIHFGNIQADETCKYIATHPGLILLDVRTKEEFEGKADPNFGSLKNAINIPVQSLESRINELDAYKGKEIFVYCSHSHRSPQAAYILTQHGFAKVTNMSGGMSVLKEGNCLTR